MARTKQKQAVRRMGTAAVQHLERRLPRRSAQSLRRRGGASVTMPASRLPLPAVALQAAAGQGGEEEVP